MIYFQNERQTRLREHARRLIAETRAKSINLDSPSSPVRSITQRITLSPERTISPINNNVNQFNYNATMPNEEMPREQSPARTTPPRGKSPLQTFNILDRISPKTEVKVRREEKIKNFRPKRSNFSWKKRNTFNRSWTRWSASRSRSTRRRTSWRRSCGRSWAEMWLETKLRPRISWWLNGSRWWTRKMRCWGGRCSSTFCKWKNLLKLQKFWLQINFSEQESDLERKYDLLNLELRAAMSVEDWRKTEEQREREKLLLAELVAIVDKRNELVLNLHTQEQA